MSEKKHEPTGLEIAVIGMAGRFPGAGNIDEFWENLKNGVETIAFFSDEELKEAGIAPGQLENPDYVKAKGILEGIENFDAGFFDYRPAEVEKMEPQIRVFHECLWEAFEDAGYDPYSYKGSIGVYAGATANFNWSQLLSSSLDSDSAGNMAVVQLIEKDFLTTCISYKFNLKGPSFPVQTACSTSLLAIHLACQGLLSGECDVAAAGGVSVTLPQKNGYFFQDGMLFSPDGHNRSFDEKAGGTVFGNGAGVVVLKLLEEAISEGDTIYAIIKGSAINNDGNRKVGFTAPSTKGQAEVIRSAIRAAEIETESIGCIEAHGTGTSMGDPIEIEALKLAFDTDKKGFCRIGSVKSNIGHMDAAAGVIGFIKVVLSLQHRLIPPSLHFDRPNPQLDLENTPFLLNTGLFQWENNKYPLRAGISSFGFGGTNAHVVLEEAPEIRRQTTDDRRQKKPQLILLSAKTPSALDKMTENLVNFLKENRVNPGQNPNVNLADAAYTLQVGRSAFKHRRMAVCSDVNEAIDALASPASGKAQTFYAKKEKRPVVFMFPGQGSQYVDMGLELYQKEPVFQEAMDHCFEILQPLMGFDIKEILYPGDSVSRVNRGNSDDSSQPPNTGDSPLERGTPDPGKGGGVSDRINQTEITQPVIFAFEYSLAKLLMKWGIKPYAMIGHSIGEYTAACLSGVFPLEDALKLVALRGKLMQKIPPGAMLSVQLPGEELESLLQSHDELSLAAVNTPILQVVSGPHQAVDRFARELAEKGYDSKRLHTSHAFHSPMMEPILKEFEENVARVSLNNPQIPYISNVTGGWIKAEEAADPGYWSTHLRRTIRFSDGLIQLLEKEDTVFVEIGPGRVLSTFVTKHPAKNKKHMTTNLVSHPKEKVSDLYYLLTKIGQLWLYGITVDWQGGYPEETRHRIPLPTYPFERKRYWKNVDNWLKKRDSKEAAPLQKGKDISGWFYIPSWKRSHLPLEAPNGKGELKQNRWLVFMDEYGLGEKLLEQLEAKDQDVVGVEIGPGYGKVGENRYAINPGEPGDYMALLAESQQVEKVPFGIAHLWSITSAAGVETEKILNRGFYSLLYLARAIAKHNITEKIRLAVVSDLMQDVTGQENLQPEKAMVMGILKVLPQEHPNINCRSIDVDLAAPGSPEENQWAHRLALELIHGSSDNVVALRANHRWLQIFEPAVIGEAVKDDSPFREKGVYMITGGLGGIGMAAAESLAKSVQARLILTGRSTFPPKDQWEDWLANHRDNSDENTNIVSRKIRQLQKLETLGAEVLALRANAADEQDMQAVVTTAENHFGALHGVIHAAGVLNPDSFLPIEEIGRTQCQEQFLPKIYGLMVLENVLKDKELDFCLLTSSLSSVLGGLGYAAYAAANIFMDAFVYKHNRLNKIKWTSVNLDHWDTTGALEPAKTAETSPEGMTMMPAEGVEALQRILSWRDNNVHQVVVSTGDLRTRINQWVKLETIRGTPGEEMGDSDADYANERPDLSTPYVTPGSQMEETIAAIWRRFLGIEKVGIHDNFFELGATSLDIIQINNKLKTLLKRNIPVVRMFEFPTVSSLAKKLSADETGENPGESKKDRSEEIGDGKKLLSQRLQKRLGQRQEVKR